MAVARYARAPVLLVGDIDRGGIFAQLLGTLWLLEPEERELVQGLVVNKFRGDPGLFVEGVRILEDRGGVPVVGVVPYIHGLGIPDEDAVIIETWPHQAPDARNIDIAVIALPRIANFDDFDPLAAEPGVQVRYVSSAQSLGQPHAVILPGTKSTMADLDWLRAQGLAEAIQHLAARGTAVVGICGGYQMLGRVIRDPEFPFWLAPVQARVEPVGEAHREAARALRERLVAEGFRVEVDERDETLGRRIREAEVEKVPFVVVHGDRESDAALAVRERGGEQTTLSFDELLSRFRDLASEADPT